MSTSSAKIHSIQVRKLNLANRASLRLDLFLIQKFPELTRSHLKQLIEKGLVLVNQKKSKASKKIKIGDLILLKLVQSQPLEIKPESIPLKIIFQDQNLLVIDKPAGLVVHPGAGNPKGTLVNAVLNYDSKIKKVGFKERPGVVHRLDKGTSGVIVIARNQKSFQNLVQQFKNHQVKKEYLALVYGKLKPRRGKIIASLKRDYHDRKRMAITGTKLGKAAETDYQVEEYFGNQFTLLKVFPQTGRTHQIRVHLKSIGYPIVGDRTYRPTQKLISEGIKLGLKRQFLHASVVEIKMLDGKKRKFKVPVPLELENLLHQLKSI